MLEKKIPSPPHIAGFTMSSGSNILLFLAHWKKKSDFWKQLEVALSYTIWLVFFISRKGKHYVFCTFQLASHFRAVSDPLLCLQSANSYLLYLVCLVSSGEILHLSAIPKSEWDWIWKCRVLQTSSFCWCCGTWQRGEQDIFLRETNTDMDRHLCACRHIEPETCTYSSVNVVHYWKSNHSKKATYLERGMDL